MASVALGCRRYNLFLTGVVNQMVKESELHKEAQPLVQRIDLQQQFGTNDLTAWFLELVGPKPEDRVLDIGCGSGNHLLPLASI